MRDIILVGDNIIMLLS